MISKRILALGLAGAFTFIGIAHAAARSDTTGPAGPDPFSIDLTPDNSALQSGEKPPTATPTNPSPVSTVIQNLNPDISLVGDFLAGNPAAIDMPGETESPIHRAIGLREIEMDGSGYVSPWAKGFFVTSFGDEEAGVEEAYLDFFNLPGSFDLKLGKQLVDLDTLNMQHQHAFPFADRPLVLHHAYGTEGLKATGANLSFLIPNPWDHYIIFSATVGSNPADDNDYLLMHGGNLKSLFYTGRLGSSWDIGSKSYLNLNASANLVPLTDGSLTRIFESDFVFRYAPNPFNDAITVMAGALTGTGRPLQVSSVTDWGYYLYAGKLISSYWKIGARYDQTQFERFGGRERQVSAVVTFYPMETHYLRFQYGRHELPPTDSEPSHWENQFWFQLDFNIGPHKAHAAL